jgi:hypothetical protein
MNSNELEIKIDNGELIAETQHKCAEYSVSQNEYAAKALELLNGFDIALFKQIEAYAARFDIPSWLVIQNIIIKRFALDAAESEVLGDNTTLLREFCQAETKTFTGNEMFDMLKQTYVHDLEMKRFERIMEFRANGWDLRLDNNLP